MQKSSFRIGIDCRLAGQQHAGIGRYVENLITRLPTLAVAQGKKIEWVFFFHDTEQATAVFPQLNTFLKTYPVKLIEVPLRHYSLAEQIRLPNIFGAEKLDLLHVPHFNIPLLYQGKIVVTIHDLLWHEYRGLDVTTLPSWQYHVKHFAYRFTVGRAVKKARRIFVPTQTIKNVVAKYYSHARQKTVVTKEGVDVHFLSSSAEKRDVPTKKSPKHLIYVGSLYPHKNIRLVIDALAKLPDYKLWIVGTRSVFQDQVRAYVVKKKRESQVEFLGYVSDQELVQYFKKSFALVQPSFSEGFGLTGVEAMASGLPVLASDIPIFREVYAEAGTYFDPTATDSFCAAVVELEREGWLKKSAKGVVAAKQYSWETMAEETFAAYLEVISERV
jgi:glycosyltransferase involved in cell wall biosynthesis